MTIRFYYGSGSPYAWRVWLTLEYKQLPHELTVVSFDKQEHRKPDYLALNPRGLVPVLLDGDFALSESPVIVEYLDEKWPAPPVFAADARQRAVQRRMIREIDGYYAPAQRALGKLVFRLPPEQRTPEKLATACAALAKEIAVWEQDIVGSFACGEQVSAVDFTLFPFLALARRISGRMPELGLDAAIGPRLSAWLDHMQQLPIVQKTWPPHWK